MLDVHDPGQMCGYSSEDDLCGVHRTLKSGVGEALHFLHSSGLSSPEKWNADSTWTVGAFRTYYPGAACRGQGRTEDIQQPLQYLQHPVPRVIGTVGKGLDSFSRLNAAEVEGLSSIEAGSSTFRYRSACKAPVETEASGSPRTTHPRPPREVGRVHHA